MAAVLHGPVKDMAERRHRTARGPKGRSIGGVVGWLGGSRSNFKSEAFGTRNSPAITTSAALGRRDETRAGV